MATPYSSNHGYDRRPRTGQRMMRTTLSVVAVGAIAAAPVAALSLWLLLTDPVLAGEVADRGSLLPIARTLIVAMGKAIAAVLAFL